MSDAIARLGIRRVINAAGPYTIWGGSRLAPGVLEAMAVLRDSFVNFDRLQRDVGDEIAALTGNEACFVSSGAAAGVAIATAACIVRRDPSVVSGFPVPDSWEVIVQKSQRNEYDYSARMTGARLVEVGNDQGATIDEIRLAIGPATACILIFAGPRYDKGTVPLDVLVETAHTFGVPVVIDAACQVPPVDSLWRYTEGLGADLAVFSGGKGLRGPQSTGLVVGRRDLVEECFKNASPRHAFGRPMKVGKEELLGVLAAVEWALRRDEVAWLSTREQIVADWLRSLEGLPGMVAARVFPGLAGEQVPQCVIAIEDWGVDRRDAAIARLLNGAPSVAVGAGQMPNEIVLNPMFVEEDEQELVIRQVRRTLLMGRGRRPA